ncbi:Holliday junction resolvase RuvX [Propionibacteriaceae bacterium Y2011]|uniref:Holliday junction resolvase RuvX n=1 Tax=Microlunatus sp. Y2014 TaxID=3418488 RepID=UPI003B4FB946
MGTGSQGGEGEPRFGVRLALDLGQARIGVAACDPRATLAYPVETVPAGAGTLAADDPALARLLALVAEYEPIEVVVGLPRSLRGDDGPAALRIREQAGRLAAALAPAAVTVRLVDERFTTTTATQQLRAAGRAGRKQRQVVDQVAAVGILEHALASERSGGQPPGELVSTPT